MIIAYLIIAFVVFFFTYQKLKDSFNEKAGYNVWIETKEFWIMLLIPLTWIVAFPLIILWKVLEMINNKITKQEKQEK